MTKQSQSFTDFILVKFIIFGLIIGIYSYYSSQIISAVLSDYTFSNQLIFIAYILLFLTAVFLVLYIIYLPIKRLNSASLSNFYHYTLLVLLSVLLIFTIFDIKLFIIMGSHVYDPFIVRSIQNSGFNNEVHISLGTVLTLLTVVILALFIPFTIQKKWSHLGKLYFTKNVRLSVSIIPVAALTFILFHLPSLSSMSKSLPFYEELGLYQTKYVELDLDLKNIRPGFDLQNYSTLKPISEIGKNKKPNILIIVAESFRSDVVNENLTPNLNQFYTQYSTIKSEHHYSGSHVSETSVFSILYGINTYNYHNFSENGIKSAPLAYLKESGYELLGYSANQLANWNGSSFLISQFDKYVENPQTTPFLDDSLVVDSLSNFNKNRDKSKPFCTFVFLNSTHHNYYFPPEFEIDKPVIAQDYNHFLGDDKLEADKVKIFNRYKNSVRYTDHNFKRILDIFHDEISRGELIVVFTGDHSEEFWDKGLLGHGAANLYNCRTEVPLLFHLPNTTERKYNFTSHQEILPTIIDYLSPSDYSRLSSRFNGESLLQPEKTDRFSVITSTNFEKKKLLCLVNSSGKYWLKADFDDGMMKVTNKFSFSDTEESNFEVDERSKEQIKSVYLDFFRYAKFE